MYVRNHENLATGQCPIVRNFALLCVYLLLFFFFFSLNFLQDLLFLSSNHILNNMHFSLTYPRICTYPKIIASYSQFYFLQYMLVVETRMVHGKRFLYFIDNVYLTLSSHPFIFLSFRKCINPSLPLQIKYCDVVGFFFFFAKAVTSSLEEKVQNR